MNLITHSHTHRRKQKKGHNQRQKQHPLFLIRNKLFIDMKGFWKVHFSIKTFHEVD